MESGQGNLVQPKKKSKKKQTIVAVLILVFGTLLAFAIFGPKDQVEEVRETPAAIVKTVTLGDVETQIASLQKTATLISTQSADALAEYSGRIRNVSFKVGDRVIRGQILAIFDQSSVENSAKESFESAQRSYDLAALNLSQTKDIADENIEVAKESRRLAELQLEQAEDGGDSDTIELAERNLSAAEDREDQAEASADALVTAAKIQLEQARNQLDQARIGYNKTTIKAPISGTIISKDIESDEYVNNGDKIAQIVGSGQLESTVYLTQSEAERVKIGDSVEIILSERSLQGTVIAVSSIANNTNQRFEVVVRANEINVDLANKTASVQFMLRLIDGQNSFYVPLEAVNIGQIKKTVFVVEDENAVAREVKTGEIVGTQIEIVEGVSSGDKLIINGNRNLQDGQKIRIDN